MPAYALIELGEIDSTNSYARRCLRELAHATVIQAQVQTAGRGREQRPWVSHIPGNLCLTVVLKPNPDSIRELPVANLSQWLALSLCRVLDDFGLHATLKWPNDIQVNGKKIAGILSETVVEGPQFCGMLLGIGVNLNLQERALAKISQPATSVTCQTGKPVNTNAFRNALLAEFFEEYDLFMATGFTLIQQEYLSRCAFLGRTIEIRSPAGTLSGQAIGVDHSGALQLVTTDGESVTISIGEIWLSPPANPA